MNSPLGPNLEAPQDPLDLHYYPHWVFWGLEVFLVVFFGAFLYLLMGLVLEGVYQLL